MPTLNENIHQAIEDFDNIKSAIIEKGVAVPIGTSTSDYGEKIKEIETGITPTGTIDITETGLHNVAAYEFADVEVPQPSGKINITENGTDIDVSEYALADVNVDTTDVGYLMMIRRKISDVGGTRYSILPTNEYRVDDNVNQIGVYAFAGLGFCETIDLSNINELGSIGDYAFFAGIQSGGVYRTSYLQSVILPKNIVNYASVGRSAFEGCTYLTTLDLRGYFRIGEYCFANSGITTLYLSADIVFSQEAFNDANSLTDIYYEGTQAQWESIASLALSGLSSSVTIHYNYTSE